MCGSQRVYLHSEILCHPVWKNFTSTCALWCTHGVWQIRKQTGVKINRLTSWVRTIMILLMYIHYTRVPTRFNYWKFEQYSLFYDVLPSWLLCHFSRTKYRALVNKRSFIFTSSKIRGSRISSSHFCGPFQRSFVRITANMRRKIPSCCFGNRYSLELVILVQYFPIQYKLGFQCWYEKYLYGGSR